MSRLISLTILAGFDPRKTLQTLKQLPSYLSELRRFKKELESSGEPFRWGKLYPCLGEKSEASGTARGHYFHQDLHVARRIFERQPRRHIDVGSRVDGFVAHVASFREIEIVDVRRLASSVQGIKYLQCDLTEDLPDALVESSDSVSCLHALEHFGLGRYGDAMDVGGYRKGLTNLVRMVRPGGWLYLSVPIGLQRVEFNAHRVFAPSYILRLMPPDFAVRAFAFVDDAGDLHDDVSLDAVQSEGDFGCSYGCGIFEFQRCEDHPRGYPA